MIQKRLKELADRLAAIPDTNCVHYWRANSIKPPVIIWQEETSGPTLWAGNKAAEATISGSIDLFTKTEFDTRADAITAVLSGMECTGWKLGSVDFEEETNMIHFTWEFTIG